MIHKILNETLTKLDKYEKMNPSEIRHSRITFDRLKTSIRLYRDYWEMPTLRHLENLNNNNPKVT